MMDPYWNSITNDIQKELNYGHPKGWSEEMIRSFLAELEDKVIEKAKMDNKIAELCGAPFIKGRYAIEQLKTITPSTFRRIFQYGSSKGQATTKHQFAIYFGYNSAEAYRNSKKLAFSTSSIQKKIKLKGKFGIGIGALCILLVLIFIGSFKNNTPSDQFNLKIKSPVITTYGEDSDVIIGKEVKINEDDEIEVTDSTKIN